MTAPKLSPLETAMTNLASTPMQFANIPGFAGGAGSGGLSVPGNAPGTSCDGRGGVLAIGMEGFC